MSILLRKGWKNTNLGKFLTFQRGFDITKRQLQAGEYDVIFSSGLGGKHNEYKVKAPGVVIGRKGTLGTVFFAKSNFWATIQRYGLKIFMVMMRILRTIFYKHCTLNNMIVVLPIQL